MKVISCNGNKNTLESLDFTRFIVQSHIIQGVADFPTKQVQIPSPAL